MRRVAAISASQQTIRVVVCVDDPVRRAALCAIVADSGHQLVGLHDSADVFLSDVESETRDTTPAVVLGGVDDDRAGLLPRDATAAQIDAALRAVAAGLCVRAAKEASHAFDTLQERNLHPLLTPRETDVLSAIAGGLGNKEIARHLEISLHTVKFHIESLLRKLNARSRAEAVAKGLARRRSETLEF